MNGINMKLDSMNSKPLVKPENTSTDGHSSTSLFVQEQFPKWITDFNEKCLKICGTKCSEKLDEMMELYIKEVKREMIYYGPGNASVVVNRMNRTILFFYLNYLDIKEFIVISQWYEHMEELLTLYCQLELRSSQRLQRGKDSDAMICSRIMFALWSFLNSKEEHMFHVLLKIPNIGRRHKEILDPIFRKLLLNKPKPLTDLEYIRRLFAFKLWKRLYAVDEKKAISELAFNELQVPHSFVNNYKLYIFLPQKNGLDKKTIHKALVTAMFDVENASKAYFEYLDKNRRSFETDYNLPEKKTFMTEFWNTAVDNIDDLSVTSDNFTLDRIKQEVDNMDIDDDCIIVEPEETYLPPALPPVIVIDLTEVIDLTADDVEPSVDLQNEIMPNWCLNLIKKSEECVPVTPPHSLNEEETEEQAQYLEKQISADMETDVTDEICRNTNPEVDKQIMNLETKQKNNSIAPLEVKISNVRRARLDSGDTDESVPDTQSSCASEDYSEGRREITSTSHPVKEVTSSNSVAPTETENTVNSEQVDSTSNENEEIERFDTTVKTFIVESTAERTNEEIVCTKTVNEISKDSNIVLSATVSNLDFEQFAYAQTQKIAIISEPFPSSVETLKIENSVSNLNIVTMKHASEEISSGKSDAISITSAQPHEIAVISEPVDEESFSVNNLNIVSMKHQESSTGKSDAINIAFANSVTENEVLEEEYENAEINVGTEENVAVEAHSESTEDDFQSPAIEPIIQNDYVDYIKDLDTSQYYENFYKEAAKHAIDIQNNRKRKNGEHSNQAIRTYTKRISKPLPVQTEVPIPEIVKPPEEKERRVPRNGEKVFRFATGLWESIFTDKFKMSKLEYELFNPSVVLKKLNPEQFIPHYNDYTNLNSNDQTYQDLHTVDHSHRDNLHLSKFSKKGIIERQEYVKANSSGENPRARIIQLNRNKVQSTNKSDIAPQRKKRGTCSPELSINLTLPKLESLLNSSFQHHFCTDISACTSASKCFTESLPPSPSMVPSFSSTILQSSCVPIYETLQTQQQQQQQQQIDFKRPMAVNETNSIAVSCTSQLSVQKPAVLPAQTPILPAEVPYWHEIDSSEPLQKFDHSQCPNLLVNINLDQSDQEIHLPIKKRRVSSLKVDIIDELSYPPTPMISIAELESIETERNKSQIHRPFKTPAELKEVPPLPASYLCNVTSHPGVTTVGDNYNINHTYNTPTINYHVNNVPVINFQYNPHYQLPPIQPIILSRAAENNWQQSNYSYIKVPIPTPGKPESSGNSGKRKEIYSQAPPRMNDRKESTHSRSVQKTKLQRSKIS